MSPLDPHYSHPILEAKIAAKLESERVILSCKRCDQIGDTVRRDHDNVARCSACYSEEFANEAI